MSGVVVPLGIMNHQTRFLGIAVLTGILFIGEIILMATGNFESTASVALGGSLAILLPALVDASDVEKRRRTPGEKAIPDDKD